MEKKVYVELPPFTGRNVPITEIAAAMHKDAQYVRIGLQQGILKFGYAIKLENSNEYNYYCPDKKGNWILPAGNRIKKELSSWQMRTLGGQYKRQLPCDYHSARIL